MMMVKFQTKRKGYDTKEVDEFLAKQEKNFQETGRRQTERIDELKGEIEKIAKQLESYHNKENTINQALLAAIEKAKEMDYTAKIRFALEGERVKIFEAKWVNYCKENNVKNSIKDETVYYLQSMEKEISDVMEEEFGLPRSPQLLDAERQFGEELERLTASKAKRDFPFEESRNIGSDDIAKMIEQCRGMLD